MGFLKSKYERQLDSLMMKIDTNMSNRKDWLISDGAKRYKNRSNPEGLLLNGICNIGLFCRSEQLYTAKQ